jgi:hypothetical protein
MGMGISTEMTDSSGPALMRHEKESWVLLCRGQGTIWQLQQLHGKTGRPTFLAARFGRWYLQQKKRRQKEHISLSIDEQPSQNK